MGTRAMSLKCTICRGRADAIRRAIEAWKREHDEAMETRDAEDIGELFLQHSEFLRDWCAQSWELLFANKLANVQETGELLLRCIEEAGEMATDVLGCIDTAESRGYAVKRSDEFRAAACDRRQMEQDLKAQWPWLDESILQKSLADIDAGHCRSAKEIFDELQRPGSQVG